MKRALNDGIDASLSYFNFRVRSLAIDSVRRNWGKLGWPKLRPRWRRDARLLAIAAGLLVCFVALFAFVQFGTPYLADNDGYYHIRMAQLIHDQGIRPSFAWLPLTILNPAAFYDHHLLYHLYLALFVGDGSFASMVRGAKVASVLMPALACLAIWWLLNAQQVPWAALWSLGLFAISEAFLYRMSMPRAQSAALLLLVLGLHWLLQRRYLLLMPLGFVSVWLYDGFPLLLVLAGVSVIATLLAERQFAWRALAYPLAGMTLGLLINPYFPVNLEFIFQHLVPKLSQPDIAVGTEWYPYGTWMLVEHAGLALALWLLGALALGWNTQRMSRATLSAFLLSIVFGLLLFKARRFVEFFPPFALIFAALSCAPLMQTWPAELPRRRWYALLLIGMLAAALAITLGQARRTIAQSQPAPYAAASGWLRTHTPPDSLIFQTDWDDFPYLFFYNTANRYTIGLDTTYMQLYNADLYDEWVAITKGQIASPGATIRDRFGATYILSDLEHTSFFQSVAHDPRVKEVYRDKDAVIFAVGD